jgi:hypothetical protein
MLLCATIAGDLVFFGGAHAEQPDFTSPASGKTDAKNWSGLGRRRSAGGRARTRHRINHGSPSPGFGGVGLPYNPMAAAISCRATHRSEMWAIKISPSRIIERGAAVGCPENILKSASPNRQKSLFPVPYSVMSDNQ